MVRLVLTIQPHLQPLDVSGDAEITGTLTVGEVSATTLDIGGTNITATATEINKLDGVTATTAELNYLDVTTFWYTYIYFSEDAVIVFDASGMFQTTLTLIMINFKLVMVMVKILQHKH